MPEFIAQNIDEWQDVASASLVPLACQRVSSVFTASHFISRWRLYEIFETVHDSPADAIGDLRETRSSAEIAFAFGFGDATTFTRAFRRYMGCTPRELRARKLDA